MKPRFSFLPALLVPLAVACAPSPSNQARDIRAPAARQVGEPVNCIASNNIRNTRVWDDSTIDFETRNGHVYRNTLPNRCPGLGFEERFAYETSINQLCSMDTVTVLYSGGQRGASCGLGKFVPVEIDKKR